MMRQGLLSSMAAAILAAAPVLAQPVGLTNGAAGQFAPSTATPGFTSDPGTIKAMWRGRLYFSADVMTDSYSRTGFGKQQPYGFAAFARIYPSFEGIAANGLKYGAYVEVRQNWGGAGPSGNTGGNTLIFRRESGWVGGGFGQLRFGQTDDALALFTIGTFENFADNWNGDFAGALNSSQTTVIYPFLDGTSGTYGSVKLVYLTPQFAGFDAGISFAPSNATSGYPAASATALGVGPSTVSLGALSGGFVGNQAALRRENNLVTAALRYRGNFGAVGVAASAGFAIGEAMHNGGLTGLSASGGPQFGYRDPMAFDGGLQVTYGGFAVGGHLLTGAINPNGSNNLMPVAKGHGGSTAFTVGASYATGPYIVGASYLAVVSPGAYGEDFAPVGGAVSPFGHRREWGIAVGGTYGYATGAVLSLTYLYGQRHQANYDFLANARGRTNNNTRVQELILTNVFTW